jgi:hypothetical protein
VVVGVEASTLRVRVDVAALPDSGLIGLVLNVAVTPAGAPETVSVTAELKPFIEVTVMFELSVAP